MILKSSAVCLHSARRIFLVASAGCLALLTNVNCQGSTWSWTGGGGANGNWNNSANWGYGSIPGNGDTVIFPGSRPNLLNTNNIPALVLNQIEFAGAGGGYDIRGLAFTLTNSILATNTAGANTIENSITLSNVAVAINVGSGVSLTLAGNLTGSVGVIKTGLGTLLYQYSGNNTYTGTTLVAGGTLQLDCAGYNAISGPLVIGDGTGDNSPTVQYLQFDELKSLPSVNINQNGLLDLNNFSEQYFTASLTMSGSSITTGNGLLTLPANSTITSERGALSVIYGNLNIGSGTLAILGGVNDSIFDAALYFYANVSGSANIVQTNVDTDWHLANTYIGNYTANGTGTVFLDNSLALGNTNNALTLNGETVVVPYGVFNLTNQSLTINCTGEFGIYVNSGSTNSWSVNITNNSDCSVDVATNAALNLVSTITGPGGLAKADGGSLTLSGINYNTYAGTTTVSGGTLLLVKSDDAIAVPSALIMEANTTVRLLDNFQIDSFTTPITLYDDSLLDLNGFTDVFGPVTLQGAQIAGDSGYFYLSSTITVNASTVAESVISGVGAIYGSIITITNTGHNFSPDLLISAVLEDAGATNGLIKAGPGEVTLTGNNTFTGPVTVNGGNLWAQTSTALGNTIAPATVNSGGSLFLDGTGLNFGLKPLVLNGAGYSFGALSCSGSSSWEGPVTLDSDSTVYQFSGSSLTLSGSIGGPGSYIKSGPGTNTFAGTGGNPFQGQTFVNAGTLNLDKVGYSIGDGALNIGDGLGTPSSTVVREFANAQIDGSSVIINSDGYLDLNGNSDLIGPVVTLNGGANIHNTGVATLSLENSTVLTVTGASTISSYLNVGSASTTCTWSVADSLLLNGSVSGAASIQDTGGGTTTLVASNSFSGAFVQQQGHLQAENNYALGATSGSLVVSNGATLELVGSIGITNKLLTLNGAGISSGWGALDVETGTDTWAGPIILNANSTFDAWNGSAALHINGPISGVGGPEVFGFGTHYYDGSASNSFAGVTTVDQYTTLWLNRSIEHGSMPGNAVVSGTLRLGNNMQLNIGADMLVNAGGLFDLGSFFDAINTLHGTGNVTFGVDSDLIVGVANGSSEFDGLMSGIGWPGSVTLDKVGTGTFTITGNNTYQNSTQVAQGTMIINGKQPQSPVIIASEGTLGGTGTVGPILGNGKLAPGDNLGILNSSNVTFNASGSFSVYLDGTNAGTGYSQLNVTGAVSLASASLQVLSGAVGAVNSRYLIINNNSAGPVAGIFNGLPEGATVTANNGARFTISYQGGAGNDVVLTQTSLPTPPQATGIQQLSGGLIQLDGSGITNLTYTVWANTNLTTTNWVSIGTAIVPANTNAFEFTDPNAADYHQRFYRFSWP